MRPLMPYSEMHKLELYQDYESHTVSPTKAGRAVTGAPGGQKQTVVHSRGSSRNEPGDPAGSIVVVQQKKCARNGKLGEQGQLS